MRKSQRRSTRALRRRRSKRGLRGPQTIRILGLLLLALALISILALLSQKRGYITGVWVDLLRRALGWGAYVAPVAVGLLGTWIIALGADRPLPFPRARALGALVLFVSALSLSHHLLKEPAQATALGRGGGYVGRGVSRVLSEALGKPGATVILVALVGVGLTLTFDLSLAALLVGFVGAIRRIGNWLRTTSAALWGTMSRLRSRLAQRRASRVKPAVTFPTARRPVDKDSQGSATVGPRAMPSSMARTRRQWVLPQVQDVLGVSRRTETGLDNIRERTRIIESTLRSLGAPAKVVEVNPGPVVTQFGLEPGYVERRDRQGEIKRVRIKVGRISSLAYDLALALAASPIRVEAPVPGKGIVGIEVPNEEKAIVGLRGVMESQEYRALSCRLAVSLGRGVAGRAIVADLAGLPHLLIAGATGSGKSVCINALIACLLCRNTPDDLRLLMIDPKRVELSAYNGIPHLLAPVVVDAAQVVGVLRWLMREMDRRYRALAQVRVRNIQAFNAMASEKGELGMPFVVAFIDELADLMIVSPEDTERSICRVAQLARATGIHLVMATQRPSVDVVTGLIKANFPARLSFSVSSQVDSRVVLDVPGAEKLLGRGDALYVSPDSPKLVRMQGCYVSDEELFRLASFWREQRGPHAELLSAHGLGPEMGAHLVQAPLWPDMVEPEADASDQDPLLDEATALVVAEGRASASLLQRKLRIGYSRAARLIDVLEARGIVGPATGSSRPRPVLSNAAPPPRRER